MQRLYQASATGLAFVLMIARSVSEKEFGIWWNINDLSTYFILLSGVIPFWATRFVAREHAGSAKQRAREFFNPTYSP